MYSDRIKKILGFSNKKPEKIPEGSTQYFTKAKKNCENMIGTVKVPVGIAGPILISGEYTNGEYVVPLATTEGALVASINRGCKALHLSGGATVQVQKVGISRAPVFTIQSAEHGEKAIVWLRENFKFLQQETEKTSHHLVLLKIQTKVKKRYLFVKFWFDSKDAMGMNMATIACDHLSKVIEKKIKVRCAALSSNWCADKKPCISHIKEGRGFETSAEVTVPRKVLNEVLKTTPERMLEVYESKIILGSELAGSLGQNAHHANIIAAIYLATGQDIAHTVEGSLGLTHLEIQRKGDVVFQVFLPSLVCGVVGGGTQLPAQKEALELMDITVDMKHPGSANQKFAEIITATVLAGELSLMAALASDDLAVAHSDARKRK